MASYAGTQGGRTGDLELHALELDPKEVSSLGPFSQLSDHGNSTSEEAMFAGRTVVNVKTEKSK